MFWIFSDVPANYAARTCQPHRARYFLAQLQGSYSLHIYVNSTPWVVQQEGLKPAFVGRTMEQGLRNDPGRLLESYRVRTGSSVCLGLRGRAQEDSVQGDMSLPPVSPSFSLPSCLLSSLPPGSGPSLFPLFLSLPPPLSLPWFSLSLGLSPSLSLSLSLIPPFLPHPCAPPSPLFISPTISRLDPA